MKISSSDKRAIETEVQNLKEEYDAGDPLAPWRALREISWRGEDFLIKMPLWLLVYLNTVAEAVLSAARDGEHAYLDSDGAEIVAAAMRLRVPSLEAFACFLRRQSAPHTQELGRKTAQRLIDFYPRHHAFIEDLEREPVEIE
jgi:hypothetical protein